MTLSGLAHSIELELDVAKYSSTQIGCKSSSTQIGCKSSSQTVCDIGAEVGNIDVE